MSLVDYLTIEYFLRNAAGGYSVALLVFLVLTYLSPSLRRVRTTVLWSFIVTGFLIAWCYPALIVGFFLTDRPGGSLFRIVSAILTVPVHAWTRAAFLVCLLLAPLSLLWWRRKPIVAALLLVPAVNVDWFTRVMETRATIAAVGGRSPGSWYENPIYTRSFPTSLSFAFAAAILALCLLIGVAVQRTRA